MAKFARRFDGKSNAGLRAKIRNAVVSESAGSPDDIALAVLRIARVVALTAAEERKLADAAEDYRQAAMRLTPEIKGVKVGPGWKS